MALDYAAYMAAWNRRDVAAVLAFVSPDIVYTDHAIHQTHVGHAGITHFVTDADNIASDFRFEPTAFVSDGTRWASEWVMSGVADVGKGPVPATGKSFEIRGASFGTLDGEGRILTNGDYWSLIDMMNQIGMMAGS